MNKEQKAALVEELTTELKDADAVFAIDYRGISVPQAAELRTGLREADARFRVVKNRLTLLAADASGTGDLKDHLKGPTALALVHGDVAVAAKTLSRLGDEWELLEYKGGLMDGAVLDADGFKVIAKLPGRDQLNAQFAGIVASPLTGLVRGLGSMIQGLALQLGQIAEQGLVSGEPPAETAAAGAAPAEDGSSDGEAGPDEAPAEPAADAGDADPEPEESPEESPSEEVAPEGEDAGEGVPQTGEGDADPGEDQGEAAQQDTSQAEETKEDE